MRAARGGRPEMLRVRPSPAKVPDAEHRVPVSAGGPPRTDSETPTFRTVEGGKAPRWVTAVKQTPRSLADPRPWPSGVSSGFRRLRPKPRENTQRPGHPTGGG